MSLLSSVEEKPGKCPVVRERCMVFNPPNKCETDSQCVGELKCCEGFCGKECLAPVKGKEGLGQADLLPPSSLSLNPLEFQAYKQGDS